MPPAKQACETAISGDRSPIEVHLVDLSPPCDLRAAEEILSPPERTALHRFATPILRRRFALRRAALRLILAGATGSDPRRLPLRTRPSGRPELPGLGLDFNASHSGDLALVAVGTGLRLGVDVEAVQPLPDGERLVDRFFSPAERSGLRALPAGAWLRGIYATWTRKEALLKARGGGLSVPLDTFDVTVDPDASPALVARRWPADDGRAWHLHALPVPRGWMATLAVDADRAAPRLVTWNETWR